MLKTAIKFFVAMALLVNISVEAKTAENTVMEIASVTKSEPGNAHEFTWLDEGQTKSFKELIDGKVAFVNFWGTWCPPCRKEIPAIIEISKELSSEDFIVVGIVLERGRDKADIMTKVNSFLKKNEIPYRNFLGSNDLVKSYGGIRAVPTTYIIDKDGKIAETIVGGRSKEDFLKSINRILKK